MQNKERPQWPSGILTNEIIKRDVKKNALPRAIALSVGAVVLAFVAWPVLMASSDFDLKTVALLAGFGILGVMATKAWMDATAKLEYRIEEDRIVSKEMQSIYEDKDAELTGMATRVPVMHLEKHGSYRINPDQFHRDYREYELYHELEDGEAVYIVYSKRTGKLLYIYRQKYWTLP